MSANPTLKRTLASTLFRSANGTFVSIEGLPSFDADLTVEEIRAMARALNLIADGVAHQERDAINEGRRSAGPFDYEVWA